MIVHDTGWLSALWYVAQRQDIVSAAYFNRVNLCATGFHTQEFVGWDFAMVTDDNAKRGKGPFEYFTAGACGVGWMWCSTA